ncbi:hypothetical protein ACI2JR_13880 [Klebsiella sp. NPDC088457]
MRVALPGEIKPVLSKAISCSLQKMPPRFHQVTTLISRQLPRLYCAYQGDNALQAMAENRAGETAI